jgi:hypothetical protein
MSRRICAVLLIALVAWVSGGSAAPEPEADEPPVRLKKKKPAGGKVDEKGPQKTEDKKPARPGEKAGDEPMSTEPVPEVDEEEVLQRVAKNLKTVEQRLARKELGDATRQVQEDILKDLDALLKLGQQQSPPDASQDQGGKGGQNNQPQDGQPNGGQQEKGGASGKQSGEKPSPAPGSRSRQRGGRQMTRGRRQGRQTAGSQGGKQPSGKQSTGGSDPGKGAGQEKPGGDSARGGGGSKSKEALPNRAADLYKDIWGHLPESMRAEMNAYFNDRQFMAKYDDLIKKYYRTIAEKGRSREKGP